MTYEVIAQLGADGREDDGPASEGCAGGCACGETDAAGMPEFDARTIPHAIRHDAILGALDGVAPGDGMVLVAPHDPLGLLAQLQQRLPDTFEVDYLQRGPEAWRLSLTRRPSDMVTSIGKPAREVHGGLHESRMKITTQPAPPAERGDHTVARSPWLMLVMATIGFAVNFWAWALISPLGPLFRATGSIGTLSESDVALLVAVPVMVGSLGRILVGGLTDRYGGRVMFPIVSGVTILPVLFIAFVALDSYNLLLFGGFFLGIAGTAFAVGVPFVNAWFPPEKRGLAIGIFGAGMGGTAISALTTVKLTDHLGAKAPFLITAAVLACYALAAWLIMRDAPGRVVPTTSLLSRIAANSRLSITWQACLLYAVAFGGYVAFSVYLPAYLKTAHGLTPADAANRMAGFVLVAVIMRPVGGWLADKLGAIPVLATGFGVVVVGAGISAGTPPLHGVGTIAFLAMAAALGAGSGATFALIAKVTDPSRVGGVTGLVGAAGGLGGFVPPLIMGFVYGRTDSYAIGLWMLCVTAALALLLTVTVVRRTAAQGQEAR
jgi:NNP family nitrate/nitrite transporter-like MFS transporter